MISPTNFIIPDPNKTTLIKQWFVYDETDRVIEIYIATVETQNEEPCLKLSISYVGETSNVQSILESQGTWEWD